MEKLRDELRAGQVFAVERIEPGVYQSVFPESMAECSSLHTTRADAWAYIVERIEHVIKYV